MHTILPKNAFLSIPDVKVRIIGQEMLYNVVIQKEILPNMVYEGESITVNTNCGGQK